MSEENRTNAPEEELTQEDINSLKKINGQAGGTESQGQESI